MKNPFNYTVPVSEPSAFIGRKELKARILSTLNGDGIGFAVSGPRRMGSTSTLLFALIVAKEKGWPTAYSDLRTLPQPVTRQAVSNAIANCFGAKAFKHLFKILEGNERALVVLDEFDLSELGNPSDILKIFLELQPASFSYRNPSTKIITMIGSCRPLRDIEGHTPLHSPFSYMFQAERLYPFTTEEALTFICGNPETNAILKPDADWLIEFAGTCPFFLSLTCYHAFNAKEDGNQTALSRSLRDSVESTVKEEARSYIADQLQTLHPDDYKILNLLPLSIKHNGEHLDSIERITKSGLCTTRESVLVPLCRLFGDFFLTIKPSSASISKKPATVVWDKINAFGKKVDKLLSQLIKTLKKVKVLLYAILGVAVAASAVFAFFRGDKKPFYPAASATATAIPTPHPITSPTPAPITAASLFSADNTYTLTLPVWNLKSPPDITNKSPNNEFHFSATFNGIVRREDSQFVIYLEGDIVGHTDFSTPTTLYGDGQGQTGMKYSIPIAYVDSPTATNVKLYGYSDGNIDGVLCPFYRTSSTMQASGSIVKSAVYDPTTREVTITIRTPIKVIVFYAKQGDK